MTPSISRNGQQRKSLAGQIDRLDAILDGLSDGLNEAVAGVVKEAVGVAVQEAVRAVLSEVLQNADFRSQFRQTSQPAQPKFRWLRAGWQVIRQTITACQAAIGHALQSAVTSVGEALGRCVQRSRQLGSACRQQVSAWLTGCGQLWRLARLFPGPVLTALAVGVATGFVVYHTGPWVSALVGGLGGFALSGVMHLGIRLRSFLPLLSTWSH
jgi:hypothetical protein